MNRTAFLITALLTLTSYLAASEVRPIVSEQSDVNSLARAGNDFALSMCSQLKDSPGNIFMSPYSISTCLALVYAGAEEQTARQMEQVLSIPIQQNQGCAGMVQACWQSKRFHAALGSLIRQLNAKGGARQTINTWNEDDITTPKADHLSSRPSFYFHNPRQPLRLNIIHRPSNQARAVS